MKGFGATGFLSAVASIAASACCTVPLILHLAGVSSAAIAFLIPLYSIRPLFLALAIGFLTWDWFSVYRRRVPATTLSLSLLTSGTALFLAALTWEIWDPATMRFLLSSSFP